MADNNTLKELFIKIGLVGDKSAIKKLDRLQSREKKWESDRQKGLRKTQRAFKKATKQASKFSMALKPISGAVRKIGAAFLRTGGMISGVIAKVKSLTNAFKRQRSAARSAASAGGGGGGLGARVKGAIAGGPIGEGGQSFGGLAKQLIVAFGFLDAIKGLLRTGVNVVQKSITVSKEGIIAEQKLANILRQPGMVSAPQDIAELQETIRRGNQDLGVNMDKIIRIAVELGPKNAKDLNDVLRLSSLQQSRDRFRNAREIVERITSFQKTGGEAPDFIRPLFREGLTREERLAAGLKGGIKKLEMIVKGQANSLERTLGKMAGRTNAVFKSLGKPILKGINTFGIALGRIAGTVSFARTGGAIGRIIARIGPKLFRGFGGDTGGLDKFLSKIIESTALVVEDIGAFLTGDKKTDSAIGKAFDTTSILKVLATVWFDLFKGVANFWLEQLDKLFKFGKKKLEEIRANPFKFFEDKLDSILQNIFGGVGAKNFIGEIRKERIALVADLKGISNESVANLIPGAVKGAFKSVTNALVGKETREFLIGPEVPRIPRESAAHDEAVDTLIFKSIKDGFAKAGEFFGGKDVTKSIKDGFAKAKDFFSGKDVTKSINERAAQLQKRPTIVPHPLRNKGDDRDGDKRARPKRADDPAIKKTSAPLGPQTTNKATINNYFAITTNQPVPFMKRQISTQFGRIVNNHRIG